MRIISSAKLLCEKYREGNSLSPLPSWGRSDHQRMKSLVGLEIDSWSPTFYPQLVCCCCRDLWIPFCWGFTAVAPALLAWAGCITTCGARYTMGACASGTCLLTSRQQPRGTPILIICTRAEHCCCFLSPSPLFLRSPSLLICLRMPPSWD